MAHILNAYSHTQSNSLASILDWFGKPKATPLHMFVFLLQFVVPESVGPRFWHRVVCYKYSNKLRHLLFFGGCPGVPMDATTSWAKLAATALVEIGKEDGNQCGWFCVHQNA